MQVHEWLQLQLQNFATATKTEEWPPYATILRIVTPEQTASKLQGLMYYKFDCRVKDLR